MVTTGAIESSSCPRWPRPLDYSPVGLLAGGFLTLLVITAVLAPLIAPFSPYETNVLNINANPNWTHLLGSDLAGRDILSRLIYGARLSLLGPAIIVLVSTALGTGMAVLAAWQGGWVDMAISRCFDIIFSFPSLLLAILAVAILGSGFTAPVIALALFYTPWVGRVVRSAAITQRQMPYIEAASVQGFSGLLIVFRHLLPNIGSIVLVQGALSFGYALIDLAGISFLGLGVQAPTAAWGVMVAEGQSSIIQGHPAESLFAGLMIVLTVVAVNTLANEFAAARARP